MPSLPVTANSIRIQAALGNQIITAVCIHYGYNISVIIISTIHRNWEKDHFFLKIKGAKCIQKARVMFRIQNRKRLIFFKESMNISLVICSLGIINLYGLNISPIL